MTFAIMLQPPVLSAAIHHRNSSKALAVLSQGRPSDAGGKFHTADGVAFGFDGGTVTPDAISPDLCALVFDAAARSNALITTLGSTDPAMRVKGSSGPAPRGFGPVRYIATPTALCAALGERLAAWRLFEVKLRDEGIIGSDDEMREPPADPGSETRMPAADSEVAASCDADERSMAAKLGFTIKTVVVSKNPDWGVVWRADLASNKPPRSVWRETCWDIKPPYGKAHRGTSLQPLEVFNPKETLAPLRAEAGK